MCSWTRSLVSVGLKRGGPVKGPGVGSATEIRVWGSTEGCLLRGVCRGREGAGPGPWAHLRCQVLSGSTFIIKLLPRESWEAKQQPRGVPLQAYRGLVGESRPSAESASLPLRVFVKVLASPASPSACIQVLPVAGVADVASVWRSGAEAARVQGPANTPSGHRLRHPLSLGCPLGSGAGALRG